MECFWKKGNKPRMIYLNSVCLCQDSILNLPKTRGNSTLCTIPFHQDIIIITIIIIIVVISAQFLLIYFPCPAALICEFKLLFLTVALLQFLASSITSCFVFHSTTLSVDMRYYVDGMTDGR